MKKTQSQNKLMEVIKPYAATGWKVLLLQATILLAWLGIYAIATYFFGDLTKGVDSFWNYIIFPIALIIIFIVLLLLNGLIAQKMYRWK